MINGHLPSYLLSGVRSGNEKRAELLTVLSEQNEEYHLTGSFFFKTSSQSSDVDLILGIDNVEEINHLLSYGFTLVNTLYKDKLIHGVLRHECGIDIQLTFNGYLKDKLNAQKYIREHMMEIYLISKTHKMACIEMWNTAIEYVKSQKNIIFYQETLSNKNIKA